MRRRLELYIPIVMLALMVQFLAPIGALRLVAHALADPLFASPICSAMASSPDTPLDPAQAPVSRHDCCSFCAASGNALASDTPAPTFVVLQRKYFAVVWLEASEPVHAIRAGSNAQARAPPILS